MTRGEGASSQASSPALAEETVRLRETVGMLTRRLEAAERAIRDLSGEIASLSERVAPEAEPPRQGVEAAAGTRGDAADAGRRADATRGETVSGRKPVLPGTTQGRTAVTKPGEAAGRRDAVRPNRQPQAEEDRRGGAGLGRLAAAAVVLALIAGGAWWWLGDDARDGVEIAGTEAGDGTAADEMAAGPLADQREEAPPLSIAPTPVDAPPATPAVGPTPTPDGTAVADDGDIDEIAARIEQDEAAREMAEEPAPPPDEAADDEAVDAAPVGVTPPPGAAETLPPAPPLPEDASPEVQRLADLAAAGDADAQHDLATAYALGQGVPRDYPTAAYWYRRAADAGMLNAIFNLGVLTDNGWGVERNPAEAFRLYLAAAEGGHPDAQNAVGLAYAQGYGTEADAAQAASWFQAASTNGNPRGAFNLGQLYERGLSGEPDLAAAAGWYQIAAERGVAEARDALDRLTSGGTTPAAPGVTVPEDAPPPVAAGEATEADPAFADTAVLSPAELRELQQLLARQGYDPGPADGVMGRRTREAIDAFAAAAGIESPNPPTRGFLARVRAAG